MNVSTDVKAGGMLQDAVQQASNYTSQATNFVSTANQQAAGLTSSVVNKTTALWNCLTGS